MLTKAVIAERRALLKDISTRAEFDFTASDDCAVSRTEIRFRCTRPGATTFADLEVARAARIELNGERLPPSAYHDGRLDLPALDADNLLVVDAEVAYSTDRLGLCAFDDDGNRFVYIKGNPVPPSPPRYVCCFMGAGRSTFALDVVAPADWTVVSHTAPEHRPEEGAAGRWRFPSQEIAEVYGVFFGAGPWAKSDVSGVRAYARPSVRDTLAASPVPELLDRVLGFYADALGVASPYGQRDCVFVPGYGAQGNATPGLLVMHERVLRASIDPDWRRYALWVIAHEAAHFWFGGVVDAAGADDLWLTEGIATYMCHRAMQELAPELQPWATFHVIEEAAAHDGEARPDAHAVTRVPTEGGFRGGIPAMSYVKPAALIRHLEEIIGREAVDAGLTRYLRAHACTDAVTDDLVECWEQVTGADLTSWSDEWLHTAGVNALDLITTTTGVVTDCVVRQGISSPGERLRSHHLTVTAYDGLPARLVARPPINVLVSGAETLVQDFIGQPAPDVVVLNAPVKSYVKVRLDERSRAALAEHLGDLDPEARAVCWVAAWEMVKDRLMPAGELDAWIDTHAGAERDGQVRELLAAIRTRSSLPALYLGALGLLTA
jgi:aminopeptidase N